MPWQLIGEAMRLRWLAERMITHSSNLATNLCLEKVGLADVQEVWKRVGATNSKTTRGIEDYIAEEQGFHNQITAADYAQLLRSLPTELTNILAENVFRVDLAAGLPAGTRIAFKNGWFPGIRHSGGIVYPDDAPPYVIVILYTGPLANGDTNNDPAAKLLASISAWFYENREYLGAPLLDTHDLECILQMKPPLAKNIKSELWSIMPHYENLEIERKNLKGRIFLSDYHGGHPFIHEYLGELATSSPLQLADISRYAGIDEDMVLRTKIAELHSKFDGVQYRAEEVTSTGGSSSLLCTVCNWLMTRGCKRVYYIPPIYYKFAYLFRNFKIQPVAVTNLHAHQAGFQLDLPEGQKSVLIVTDPIWYAGQMVPEDVWKTLREWQIRTGSLIFVDGTFQ